MKVFLDTNILVDFFAKRESFWQDAAQIFALAEKQKVEVFTSPLVLSNAFFVLKSRYKLDKKQLRQQLNQMSSYIKVCNFQGSFAEKALRDEAFTDFEDALHAFNAADEAMDYIITRNEKDFTHSEVEALSPQAFLALVKLNA